MDRKLPIIITALIQRLRDFPDDAINEMFLALGVIEKKFDLQHKLSEQERIAIDESIAESGRGGFVPDADMRTFFAQHTKGYDADASGRAALDDAVLRLKNLPGEAQSEVADVIFALLNEPRFDIPPPPPNFRPQQS